MKKGFAYTLGFMVVLSAVLTFLLAFAYESFKPSIAANAQLSEQRALLDAFDRAQGVKDQDIPALYDSLIKPGGLHEQGYTLEEDGEVKGYALPFEGSGLWGTIRGYVGMSADKQQLTGLVFTSQNETPGLGGRIEEPQFKDQFRKLPVAAGQPLKYGVQDGYQLDAVTGATQTSSAVLRIVNQAVAAALDTKEAP